MTAQPMWPTDQNTQIIRDLAKLMRTTDAHVVERVRTMIARTQHLEEELAKAKLELSGPSDFSPQITSQPDPSDC